MNMNMHSHEHDAQRIDGSAEPRHFIKVSFTLHEHPYQSEMVHETQERDVGSRRKRISTSPINWEL